MKRYIIYYRPRKRLSQFDEHFACTQGFIGGSSLNVHARNKEEARGCFRSNILSRYNVIEEIVEI